MEFQAVKMKFVFIVFLFKIITIEATTEVISDTVVHTQNGPVQGILKTSRDPNVEFVSFMGLRYADPPARFEPAQPLQKTWSTPKVANTPGNICPQMSGPKKWDGNEDCLFLSVHVPKSALEDSSKRLPVMVWIHGGGFAFGDGHNYGAEYLMETQNIILITINYRLSLLGFISMENDSAFTANNGLRDILTALKWIQENIAAFHGNPEKVTIAGNSAGSAAVHYLLQSPLAKNLFHSAIMQSGAFSFWSYSPNPKKDASQVATLLNCPDTENPAAVRKCLEEKSVADLLIGQTTFSPRWPPAIDISRFSPTAKEPQHNAFFAGEPSSFFTSHGKQTKYVNKVPVMAGVVRDEGSTLFTAFVLAEEKQLKQLDVNWDRLAPRTFCYESFFPLGKLPWMSQRLREYYFGKAALNNNSIEFLTSLYSDSLFLLPVMQAARDMAKQKMSVYPYVFSYLGEWSLRDGIGLPDMPGKIGHADELQYLFPHPLLGPPLKPDSDAEKFSKRLVKFWTSLVASGGHPSEEWFEGEPLPWKPISSSKNFEVLRLNSDPKVVSTFQFADRLEFWRKTSKEAVGGNKKQGSSDKEEL